MKVLAIGLGGFIGAILRYSVGHWIPPMSSFPEGTLLVNLLGCLFLGWFLKFTGDYWKIREPFRLAIGTGLTGSFTTFSSFSVQTLHLIQNGHTPIAILYIFSSVIGGIILAWLGYSLANIIGKSSNLSSEGSVE